jgi:hypothetical protein
MKRLIAVAALIACGSAQAHGEVQPLKRRSQGKI